MLSLAVHAAVMFMVAKKNQKFEYDERHRMYRGYRKSGYYYDLTNGFTYGKDIRVYRLRDLILKHYRAEIDGYIAVKKGIMKYEFKSSFLSLASLLISDAVTYGFLIYYSLNGLPISDFLMYVSASVCLTGLLTDVAGKIGSIIKQEKDVRDFYDYVDSDMYESGGDLCLPEGGLDIELRDISFTYPGTETPVCEGLNLQIKKGEKLALVGVNGAGKSTLVKLITGLYSPQKGEVLINGVNAGEYSKKELQSAFSVVFQEVNIFALTVGENIAACSGAGESRLLEAAEKAGISGEILSYEKKFDQPLLKIIEDGGIELSGGESQKIAIARALYKNGGIIILDEPTAALDAVAEAGIYEKFGELTGGKTTIYISHRLASTKFCDKIALMDHGVISEFGTHSELMEAGGKYFEMYTSQAKHYSEATI